MKTTVEQIRKALEEFPPDMEVRPRFHPLMSDIDEEHVSARQVTYIELVFHYFRPPSPDRRPKPQPRPQHPQQGRRG